jgi:hypothetical protein
VPDILADGASWLAGQLKAVASRPVVFVRGNSAIEVSATIGASSFQAADQNGLIDQWESRDFIIATADLPFGDPQRGDKVVETIDGIAITYEVSTPRGLPLWRYGDAFRMTVRVHTVQSESGTTYITTEDGDLLIA